MFAPSNYSNLRVTFPVKMFRGHDRCNFVIYIIFLLYYTFSSRNPRTILNEIVPRQKEPCLSMRRSLMVGVYYVTLPSVTHHQRLFSLFM